MSPDRLTEQGIIDFYGTDALIQPREGSLVVSIGQALMAESAMCSGDPSKTADPTRRAAWLLRGLDRTGALADEHRWQLPAEES